MTEVPDKKEAQDFFLFFCEGGGGIWGEGKEHHKEVQGENNTNDERQRKGQGSK